MAFFQGLTDSDPAGKRAPTRSRPPGAEPGALAQYSLAIGAVGIVTLAAFVFTPLVGAHATALVFLLTVVLLALLVERGPILAAAGMSALLWDYFFLPPIYALRINHFEDAMLLAVYFVVALVLADLTSRIRAQQAMEQTREAHATALYLLTRDLNESIDLDQMVHRLFRQIDACFESAAALWLLEAEDRLVAHPGSTVQISESERDLLHWVIYQRRRAGRFTPERPQATMLFIPLVTASGPVGVLGLSLPRSAGLTLHQDNLLDAFSQQVAMALDRHRLNRISERTKLLAESERLSKTLLDSVSHEMRTPIAAIQSATGNLAQLSATEAGLGREMLAEIQEATHRLNRMVGNVLAASRLESGNVRPRFTECDVRELINIVLADAERDLKSHQLSVNISPGLPLIPLDFVLTQQAIANLISNAVFHTAPGTLIEVRARCEEQSLILTVADRGPGIPAESLSCIFDKFYRVPDSRTGGTGLGLSLVKGFIEAQGGQVSVQNRLGGGVAFSIRFPIVQPAPVSHGAQV